jgi:16S rRNA (cytosine967-C5)-methyltransferase
LNAADGRLLNELVMGTLRWLRRIDAVVEAAARRPLSKIDAPLHSVLRVAVYQLCFLDRVPAHAVVNEAVDEARRRTHRGGAGFVNAVLRRVASGDGLHAWPVAESDPVRRLAVEQSHPDFLVSRWVERLGLESARQVLEVNNLRPRTHLLALGGESARDELATRLAAEGCRTEPSPVAPCGLRLLGGDVLATTAFAEGLCYIQNEASQVAALLPPPEPGERVLDVAAAPGGKSFSMLAREPTVRSTLVDVDAARLTRLRDNVARLGVDVSLVGADGRQLPFAPGFDRVLVDAPCSGSGTLRKNPELKWRLSTDEIDRLAAQSLALLRSAAGAVRPGGLLVLVTCSLEPEENEDVVRSFLEGSAAFDRVDLAAELAPAPPGLVVGDLWRWWPGPDNDGFTVCALRRRNAGNARFC